MYEGIAVVTGWLGMRDGIDAADGHPGRADELGHSRISAYHPLFYMYSHLISSARLGLS